MFYFLIRSKSYRKYIFCITDNEYNISFNIDTPLWHDVYVDIIPIINIFLILVNILKLLKMFQVKCIMELNVFYLFFILFLLSSRCYMFLLLFVYLPFLPLRKNCHLCVCGNFYIAKTHRTIRGQVEYM